MTEKGDKQMCNEKVEVYSRVIGYFRPISNWNAGKQEEFRERKFFNLNKKEPIAEKVRV
jgi:anaerobic ribonucleoside-triphosphate reductase